MNRYLSETINIFAHNKFVLLAGPRQVGKTTLAKEWLSSTKGQYLNWDVPEDRVAILKRTFLNSEASGRLVLDEIHKYPRWKNYLKGLFDRDAARIETLVTGSARLDFYKRGGDSLFGRYELLRLHPFSIGELTRPKSAKVPVPPSDWLFESESTEPAMTDTWARLSIKGGFPEPYSSEDPLFHTRWSTRRRELLIREDLRDLTDIKLVELIEHLYLLLPERVGSPLSINALKEEVGAAFNSVSNWLDALDRLYISFRLSPYSRNIARSLKKERKLYLWDWSQIDDTAKRFENMVASHLLKSVHYWTDLGYGNFDLHYWRNKEKKEVDFVVVNNRKPIVLIECKRTDASIAASLIDLANELGGIPAIQLVETPGIDIRRGATRVVTAADFLRLLV